MTTHLRSDQFDVLQIIHNKGPILVKDIKDHIPIDQGKIEAAVGTLSNYSLIEKNSINNIFYELTKRGIEIKKNGLPEKIILSLIIDQPLSFPDLSNLSKLSKSDLTAGIGILKKLDLISFNQGIISFDENISAIKSIDEIFESLKSISKNSTPSDPIIIKKLIERGLILKIDHNEVKVNSLINDKQLAKIIVKEEITKLTSKMIADRSWNNYSIKPYSLKSKPRIIYPGRFQPYRQFIEHLKRKLIGLGFNEMKGPIIEQEFWNFDALYAHQDHSAREDSDILLIKNPTHGELIQKDFIENVKQTHENGWQTGSIGHNYKWDPKKAARLLLRPQGTSISARTLYNLKIPSKYFSIARCFRPDQIDATHAIEFNQTEGIICDPNITFRDLLGILKTFAIEVAGAEEVRFRPDYYPFTSPSVELSAKHPKLGYIEFGGAGIFRPEVTKPFGIDHPVLAWGLGVERLFMTKFNISDIRSLYSQDLDWLRSEKVSSGMEVDI